MNVVNPFPGLRPFEATDSHLFFGRETATDELLRKLRNNRFITVIGTSGSGKSSLVKAGMLPDLYGGFMVSAGSNWQIVLLRPGHAPVHSLAEALVESGVFGNTGQEVPMQVAINETVLRQGTKGLIEVVRQARMQPDTNLLVVVDQFEELFRFINTQDGTTAKEEAAAFVKLLLEASKQVELPIYVILTMRSEYLGDCTQFRDLPEAINEGQYLIPRMTRDQKRLAITGPVAVGGAKISPRLVQRLLNDVGDNPDQLPIMQHAMMRSWEYWEKGNNLSEPIDLSHYEATGGMNNALSRHADEAFEELADKKTKKIAQFIFKRLTGQGVDNREIRFPTTVIELCSVSDTDEETLIQILDIFRKEGRSFLMPPPPISLTSDTLIDISHESLIRIWKRLRQWVDEEIQSARIYRRLSDTAVLYNNNKAGLWRDPDLQITLDWRKENQPNEVWAQRYDSHYTDAMFFIDKSRTTARRRKIVLQTATVLLPLVLVGYYVYELKKDVSVLNKTIVTKETNILDLQSTVSDSKEVMIDLAQKLTQDTNAIQSQGPLGNNAGIIVQEVTKAVTKLQKTVEHVEQVEQAAKEVELEMGVPLGEKKPEGIDSSSKIQKTENGADQSKEDVTMAAAAQLLVKNPTTEEDSPLTDDLEPNETVALDFPAIYERCHQTGGSLEIATITRQLQQWKGCLNQPNITAADKELIIKEAGVIETIINTSAIINSDQDFVTCKNVTALTPTGCDNQFSKGKVYIFARVRTPRNELIELVWYNDGKEFSKRQLTVKKSEGYRTFAWKWFSDSGNYKVALFNQNGVLIAERNFSIN